VTELPVPAPTAGDLGDLLTAPGQRPAPRR
jgi:hypothetical protein